MATRDIVHATRTMLHSGHLDTHDTLLALRFLKNALYSDTEETADMSTFLLECSFLDTLTLLGTHDHDNIRQLVWLIGDCLEDMHT